MKYFLRNPQIKLERKTEEASGYDLVADIPGEIWIDAHHRAQISTGLFLEMERGVEAQVRSRSGLALKHGIMVSMGVGTIDADYRGEVTVSLTNTGVGSYVVHPGDRVAQIVFAPVFAHAPGSVDWMFCNVLLAPLTRVASLDELNQTDRGVGGHGSTGR